MKHSEKPNIMQVIGNMRRSGVARGTLEIDAFLMSQGWGSIVVSSGGPMAGLVQGRHVLLKIGAGRWYKRLLGAYRIKKLIEAHDVDLVHARNRGPAWAAYLAARWTGKPFVTTCHAFRAPGTARKKRYDAILAKGDHVIAVSQFIKRHVVDDHGVDPANVTMILRGADIENFNPGAKRAESDLPRDRPIVMLPGRLVRWKGHKVFIDALRGLDAHGVIIGDVHDKSYLKELTADLPPNVTILPSTADMPGMLANADVVVSASTSPEAFGRVAVEGQAMGKPVVATNIGGSLETVIDGVTGRLVPPNDAEAMAEAISECLVDPQRYRDACVRNAQTLSIRQMCETELALYERILAK
jgi:glycosyltransferase involved in cell wall biosynthesis